MEQRVLTVLCLVLLVLSHAAAGAEPFELLEVITESAIGFAKAMLEAWLEDPKALADALGIDESELMHLTPEQLIEYFKERLKEQTERHDGGGRWVGTGGRSPFGHGGEAVLQEIHALGVDLYLHQQNIDTSTPSGKAMFQMVGVFAEFERAMIQERVKAGLARARKTAAC